MTRPETSCSKTSCRAQCDADSCPARATKSPAASEAPAVQERWTGSAATLVRLSQPTKPAIVAVKPAAATASVQSPSPSRSGRSQLVQPCGSCVSCCCSSALGIKDADHISAARCGTAHRAQCSDHVHGANSNKHSHRRGKCTRHKSPGLSALKSPAAVKSAVAKSAAAVVAHGTPVSSSRPTASTAATPRTRSAPLQSPLTAAQPLRQLRVCRSRTPSAVRRQAPPRLAACCDSGRQLPLGPHAAEARVCERCR